MVEGKRIRQKVKSKSHADLAKPQPNQSHREFWGIHDPQELSVIEPKWPLYPCTIS